MNHLFYMNDLKTITKNDEEQQSQLTIVKGFSDDIKMVWDGKMRKSFLKR